MFVFYGEYKSFYSVELKLKVIQVDRELCTDDKNVIAVREQYIYIFSSHSNV